MRRSRVVHALHAIFDTYIPAARHLREIIEQAFGHAIRPGGHYQAYHVADGQGSSYI